MRRALGEAATRRRLVRAGPRSVAFAIRARPVAFGFTAAFGVTSGVLGLVGPAGRDRVAGWVSTSVDNLGRQPIGALVGSAFVAVEDQMAWLALCVLGLFAADRALGWRRLLAAIVTAQVVGSLVSEGVVWWQVAHGVLPASARTTLDVGPSYIVVAGLTVGLLRGSWPGRLGAALGCWLLYPLLYPHLFGGLSRLQVAAVGHVVSVAVGALFTAVGPRSPDRAAAVRETTARTSPAVETTRPAPSSDAGRAEESGG